MKPLSGAWPSCRTCGRRRSSCFGPPPLAPPLPALPPKALPEVEREIVDIYRGFRAY
jgi:hypothetical protein